MAQRVILHQSSAPGAGDGGVVAESGAIIEAVGVRGRFHEVIRPVGTLVEMNLAAVDKAVRGFASEGAATAESLVENACLDVGSEQAGGNARNGRAIVECLREVLRFDCCFEKVFGDFGKGGA